jgi:hypothetical protein
VETVPRMELEDARDHSRFAPGGRTTAQQAAELITAAVAAAREQGKRRLLIDLRALQVTEGQTWLHYYDLGESIARAGRGVKVALVMDTADLSMHKFTLLVATNRGLVGAAFLTDAAAVAWLLSD